MKKEKVVLSFIGVIIGLICAGAAFYIYQSTKAINTDSIEKKISPSPTPIPESTLYLTISEPADEQVVSNKILEISGQTVINATVLIITKSTQEIIKPTQSGNFKTTITLENGQNLIRIVAYDNNGESSVIERTISYSTEDF